MKSIGLGVYFTAWFVVLVEWAFYMVVLVYFNVVVRQNHRYGQPVFDVGDLHLKKSLKIFICELLDANIDFIPKPTKNYPLYLRL